MQSISPLPVLVVVFVTQLVSAQIAWPKIKQEYSGCLSEHVKVCQTGCASQYHDTTRYLCPCYSKMGTCLVRIGCTMRQRIDIMAFCTRKGYCKDGYCIYRAGDLTPRIDTRIEVFELTSVATPGTPCVDNCCPSFTNCTENTTLLAVRTLGREYRKEEPLLPPRQGDPRLGVNQNYDRMPYSIPLANLP